MEGFLLRNRVEWDRLRHAFAGIYGVPLTGVEQFDNEGRTQDAPVLVELYEHENGCKLNITIHAAIKNQPRAIDLARRVAVALEEDVITSPLGHHSPFRWVLARRDGLLFFVDEIASDTRHLDDKELMIDWTTLRPYSGRLV
jgi:hypothetical protein